MDVAQRMQGATKMSAMMNERIAMAAMSDVFSKEYLKALIDERTYGFFLGPWCRALSRLRRWPVVWSGEEFSSRSDILALNRRR